MYKIMIFGNGAYCSFLEKHINKSKVEILGYINSLNYKKEDFYENKAVIVPSEINNYEFDYILIGSGDYDTIIKQLDYEQLKDKILVFNINSSNIIKEKNKQINLELKSIMNEFALKEILNIELEDFFICNMPLLGRNRDIIKNQDYNDFIRLSTLELISKEIGERGIEGEVAELGVYKGEFSEKISRLFKDKKLYLFDTFEGFKSTDIQSDTLNGYSKGIESQFSDTSVDEVREKIFKPERCLIKKGRFPDTALNIDIKFSFVSIDVDLHDPTYEGLKYFYPRLSPGGYIIIHDYNNDVYKGTKEAVRKYCLENKISYTPVSDTSGSVIITK